MGSATSVSITGASRQRVRLSQWASGRPISPSTAVVMVASRSVSQSDSQSAGVSRGELAGESGKGGRLGVLGWPLNVHL